MTSPSQEAQREAYLFTAQAAAAHNTALTFAADLLNVDHGVHQQYIDALQAIMNETDSQRKFDMIGSLRTSFTNALLAVGEMADDVAMSFPQNGGDEMQQEAIRELKANLKQWNKNFAKLNGCLTAIESAMHYENAARSMQAVADALRGAGF